MQRTLLAVGVALGLITALALTSEAEVPSVTGGNWGQVEVGGSVAGGATINDDNLLCFGTDCDYWIEYNSTGTQWEFWTTDADGGGSDGLIWSTSDGTDNLALGDDRLLILDDDGDTFLRSSSDDNTQWFAGTASIRMNGTVNSTQVYINNDVKMTYGSTGTSLQDGFSTEDERNISVTIIDVDDTPYSFGAAAEVVVCDSDAGTGAPADITINLPAASCTATGTRAACRVITVKNIGATNNCIIDANGAEEIDNALTLTLNPGDSVDLIDINQTDYHWMVR